MIRNFSLETDLTQIYYFCDHRFMTLLILNNNASSMKKIYILAILAFLTGSVTAQYNHAHDITEDYCSHKEQFLKQQYYAPLASDPLLDQYDVTFYFLNLEVENNTVDIAGDVTIEAKVVVPVMDTFAFELIPAMNISNVHINGIQHTFTRSGDLVTVELIDPLNQDDMISAQIFYAGTPTSGGFFSGVTTGYSSQWGKNMTWTLSEPYAAKDWFPVKQDLQDKADSCWVFLTTSDENMAGSQGLLTAVTPVPGDKLRYEWKSNYPIVYYLISFAVADYQEYNIYAHPEGYPDSILIQNFIYDSPGALSYYQEGIDRTVDFLELFSGLFSMYPFAEEKYGHCLTTLGGGMEHQTMTTIGGFSFGLVAHELGHMWYGDNVTCATWSDIWINEGFATYSDYLATEHLLGYAPAQSWLQGRHANVKSAPGGSVYVPGDELGNVWRIFDGRLSYNKGALLLHMIRWELNDDSLFYQVLQEFSIQYADSTATGDDFKELLEDESGMEFDPFFEQWYYGEGYPIYDITWNQDQDSLYVFSTQTTSTSVTTLFEMTMPYYVLFEDGSDTTYRLYQQSASDQFAVGIPAPVYSITVDPEQWVLHQVNSLLVGLEEIENPSHFSLAPNPAGDRLHIYFTHGQSDHQVIITDLTGRKVMEGSSGGGQLTLDVSSLPQGIYLVTANDGAARLTRKMVKR